MIGQTYQGQQLLAPDIDSLILLLSEAEIPTKIQSSQSSKVQPRL